MALVRPDGSPSVPIQRSPLFRERKVRLELWGPSTGVSINTSPVSVVAKSNMPLVSAITPTGRILNPTLPAQTPQTLTQVTIPPFSIDLTEVRSIRPASPGATAVLQGVVSPIFQPWYFGLITFEIRGESHMGAFKNSRLNVAVDNDVEKLWQLRERVNERFALSQESVQGLKVVLTIGDSGPENLSTNQKFWGNIDNIETEENDEKPYIWTYVIRYTGDFYGRFITESGTTGANDDAAVAASADSTSLGTGPIAQR